MELHQGRKGVTANPRCHGGGAQGGGLTWASEAKNPAATSPQTEGRRLLSARRTPSSLAPAAAYPLFPLLASKYSVLGSAEGAFVPLCVQDLITQLVPVVGRIHAKQHG